MGKIWHWGLTSSAAIVTLHQVLDPGVSGKLSWGCCVDMRQRSGRWNVSGSDAISSRPGPHKLPIGPFLFSIYQLCASDFKDLKGGKIQRWKKSGLLRDHVEQSPHHPALDSDMNEKLLPIKPSTVRSCVLQQLTFITLTNNHLCSLTKVTDDVFIQWNLVSCKHFWCLRSASPLLQEPLALSPCQGMML